MTIQNILELKNVSKKYQDGENTLTVLNDINLEIKAKEAIALVSPSGSGKSTLLQIVGLVSSPSSGKVFINNKECNFKNDKQITNIRRKHIGFIYQFHHLLREFNSVENVMLPLLIQNFNKELAKEKAMEILEQVKLKNKAYKYPHELSGGQRQRIAIARAFANSPSILIADEPTGNLDNKLAQEVFELMLDFIELNNTSAIVATHNVTLAKLLNKNYKIESNACLVQI